MPRAHFIDFTNHNGSSKTLCGRWGRHLETFPPDATVSPCKRCLKVAKMREVAASKAAVAEKAKSDAVKRAEAARRRRRVPK
jgi:hypothetical protein